MKKWILCALALFCTGCAQEVVPAVAVSEEKYVALTFDDGPLTTTTPLLLDGLAERDAKATFFILGDQANQAPDVVRRIRDEGHQIASHTQTHLELKSATQAQAQQDIAAAQVTLNHILDEEETYWLRPPYGLIDQAQYNWVDVPMIFWTVDPKDWEVLDTQAVVEAVVSQVQPGDIILLHDVWPTSVAAALEIIDTLAPQGYCFVTVEELFAIYGVEAEPSVVYRSPTGEPYTVFR